MGPTRVERDCGISCLLPPSLFIPLTRFNGPDSSPLRTVGDVLDLARKDRLRDVPGLTEPQREEIKARLIRAGWSLDTEHDHRHDHGFDAHGAPRCRCGKYADCAAYDPWADSYRSVCSIHQVEIKEDHEIVPLHEVPQDAVWEY